jgi:hypothetical protein
MHKNHLWVLLYCTTKSHRGKYVQHYSFNDLLRMEILAYFVKILASGNLRICSDNFVAIAYAIFDDNYSVILYFQSSRCSLLP